MNKFKINYFTNNEMPKLAWLAAVDREKGSVSVVHGQSVECKKEWMVEGVWDDDFDKGNFHQSENFFGSGLRVENDLIYFVPSSAPVDRLLYCFFQKKMLVSNSQLVILAATGARLDENHNYHRESLGIMEGIKNFKQEFMIIHPQINSFYQVFYKNIVISAKTISFQKRSKVHSIKSFSHYYKMMSNVLLKIKKNYTSPKRKISMSAFSTISTGYDSCAVSCLVKNLGVNKVFTGNSLNPPLNLLIKKRWQDSGQAIALSLGLEPILLNHKRSSITEDELYFLATTYPKFDLRAWSEISFHSMASYIENNCSAALVFTGYYGGEIWDVNLEKKYLNDQIPLKDRSGFNLSEIRLKSGFINVPVPHIYARSLKDIVKISRSPEMKSWRLNTTYDRPIPRRIAESAGVKRELFGTMKKFIASKYMWPVNSQLRKQFSKYLRKYYGISPPAVFIEYLICLIYPTRPIQWLLKAIGLSIKRKNFILKKNIDIYFLMSHWAVGILTNKLAKILKKDINKILSIE